MTKEELLTNIGKVRQMIAEVVAGHQNSEPNPYVASVLDGLDWLEKIAKDHWPITEAEKSAFSPYVFDKGDGDFIRIEPSVDALISKIRAGI